MERLNTTNQLHEKNYTIGIYNSTDDFGNLKGSGVKSLQIYARATDIGDGTDAVFSEASRIGSIDDVDNTPSYTKMGNATAPYYNTTLVLRNKDSKPITTDSDKVPKHNSNNIYPFKFINYVNGSYYNFWVLAVDKAGWIETLDDDVIFANQKQTTVYSSGVKKGALFTTTARLTDDIAPQFDGTDGIITLENLTWSGSLLKYTLVPPSGVNTTPKAQSYFKDKIITFTISGVQKLRYINDAAYSASKIELEIDTTGISGTPADTNSTKLLPVVSVTSGIGSMRLTYPLSNSVNLKAYKIERLVENLSTLPLAGNNILTESGLSSFTYQLVGYIDAESFTDVSLVLNRVNLTDHPDTKKFLYKVSPVSQYSSYTNNTPTENCGQAIYTTKLNFNSTNYRPCAGEIPSAISYANMTTGSNADIILKWSESSDSNNDLKGYEIQRARLVDGTAESYVTLENKEADLFEGITEGNYKFKYIDSGLEVYNPDKITYSYRVRATDWGGNVSAPKDFTGTGNVTSIPAVDTTAPVAASATLAVIGRLGGWKGRISLPTDGNFDDVVGAQVFAKSSALSGSVDGATERLVGFFAIEPGQHEINFLDLSIPSSGVVWYAKYAFMLKDVNNNISSQTSYAPSSAVASETPQTVVDNIAPSTQGYTLTLSKVPDLTDITVVSATSNGVVVSGITVAADDLKGKRISTLGGAQLSTEVIASNLVTSGGNTSITISGTWLLTPSAGVKVSIDPMHVKVSVTVPTTNLTGTSGGTSTKTDIVDTGKTWGVNFFKGWDVDVNGVTQQIISNTATSLTLKEALENNAAGAYAIHLPADIAGYRFYRGKWNGTSVESWQFVTDTFNGYTSAFSVVDRNISNGDWKYGIISYDLSGNDSIIYASTGYVTLVDNIAPGVPEIKGIVGGVGNLNIYWNATADDIDYYELYIKDKDGKYVLDNDGSYIAAASRNVTAKKEEVQTTQFTLYGVVDSIDDIKLWSMKVVAYDFSGNAITTQTEVVPTGKFFLTGYEPATGIAPANPTSFTLTSDNDGGVILSIPIASLNVEIGSIIIQRRDNKKYSNNGVDSWTAYKTVATITGPEIDSANTIISDINYTDFVNDRLICEYKLKAVGRNGLPNAAFTSAVSVNVVDFTGYDLGAANLSLTVDKDFGWLKLRFKDILDKSNAKYEIFRTPVTGTTWSAGNFFTKTNVQPKAVDSNWELIDAMPSTKNNKTDFDFITYVDNDWDNNGTIEPGKDAVGAPFTTLSTPYDGKACYAIVGIDQWGNRGTPYFVPGGAFSANSVIVMPAEARENNVPDGSVFFNFNKGVQSSIGHSPIDIPEGVLYKGCGIQPTGSFRYLLDKFTGNYTVLLKKLEKLNVNIGQVQTLGITGIIDIFLYDTSLDTVDNAWTIAGGCPGKLLLIANSTILYGLSFTTGELYKQWTISGINGIHALNGLIRLSGTTPFRFIDLINNATTVQTVTVSSTASYGVCASAGNKVFSAVAGLAGLHIHSIADNRLVSSIDTVRFNEVVMSNDCLYSIKNGVASLFRASCNVSTMFSNYTISAQDESVTDLLITADLSSVYVGQTLSRIILASSIYESITGTRIKLVNGLGASPNYFIVLFNSGRNVYFSRGAVDIESLYSTGSTVNPAVMTIDSFAVSAIVANLVNGTPKYLASNGSSVVFASIEADILMLNNYTMLELSQSTDSLQIGDCDKVIILQ